MKERTFWWLVAALVAVRLVLMATVPVFEPSEARYAAISANMARSGDFVIPRFTHNLEYQSFDGKPPLVFQAGGLFCKAFGVCEFAVRLFPFLSAVLLLAILYRTVRRFSDAATGRLAVLVCASCTAFYAAAGISMTDMTLTCCVAGALLLYRCFLDGFALRDAAGVAVLLGAGMITKGPVSLVMFGLPVLVDAIVNRRGRGIFNWKWLAVAPLYLLVAVPWFVLVEQRNSGAVLYFFYNENFLRFVSHDYGDKYGAGREAFRGVSVLWALVATLPWSLVPLWQFVRCRLLKSPNPPIPQSPNHPITQSPNHPITQSPHHPITQSPNPPIPQSPNHPITQSPNFNWKSFSFLALLAIVGFWCLTSRVLLYYLFPVVPLFAAWLVLSVKRESLARLAVPCVGVTILVLVGGMFCGMSCSDKMLGARTPFHPLENHYAYEFYHGRPSEKTLEKCRAAKAAYLKQREERKAVEAAARKAAEK